MIPIMNELFKKTGKSFKVYAELLEHEAQMQFLRALEDEDAVKGALMPDCHTGYSLPIGGVIAMKDKVSPAFVGFDIGCGLATVKTSFTKEQVEQYRDEIFNAIYDIVPVGRNWHSKSQKNGYLDRLEKTDFADKIYRNEGKKQLGTLGGGNHFCEVGYDENGQIWITIHSGSRNVGKKLAEHYMLKAYMETVMVTLPEELAEEFEKRNANFKKYKPEEFELKKAQYIKKQYNKSMPNVKTLDSIDTVCKLDINGQEGQDYIKDLNFALEFALENRKHMIATIYKIIADKLDVENSPDFKTDGIFINRNHNHAVLEDGLWVHRKGATHAQNGMFGVIPGNMRDGCFVVKGKGNPESLASSSHGAGRVLSRKKAKENIDFNDFKESMKDIKAKVDESTKDESPFAYKDIFEVMRLQEDLVDIVAHVRPIINIKG